LRQIVGRDEPLRVVFVDAWRIGRHGQNVGFCHAGVRLSGKGRRVLLATGKRDRMRVILTEACAERVHGVSPCSKRADRAAFIAAVQEHPRPICNSLTIPFKK